MLTRDVLAARMPLLLPAHQLGGDRQLLAIDVLREAWRCSMFLSKKLERIHVELGGQIVQRAHGEHGSLRMVRRAPCARRTDVVANRRVLFALVGNLEDVRHRRHASATRPARAPRSGLPRDEGAVFLCADLHPGVSRGTRTRRLSIRNRARASCCTGLPPAFFESLAVSDAPAVGPNLLPNPPPMWSWWT